MTNWPATVQDRPQQRRRARIIGEDPVTADELADRRKTAMRKLIAIIVVVIGLILAYAMYAAKVARIDAEASASRSRSEAEKAARINLQELPTQWKQLASRGDRRAKDARLRMKNARVGEHAEIRDDCVRSVQEVIDEADKLDAAIAAERGISDSLRANLRRDIDDHVTEWRKEVIYLKRAGQ
jgi:hypothetical protein